jgi:ABC-2 type transport system permease protein
VSWQAIARKDVHDAIRSRGIWLLSAAFLLVFLAPPLAFPSVVAATTDEFVNFTRVVVGSFVPLVSIALGYKAVVGERESGSIALVLSFPHTRRDLAIGKLAGRAVVLAIPLLVAVLAAGVVAAVQLSSAPLLPFLGLVLATLGLGLAFLGLTVGLSMATPSSRRITGAAIGAYLLFALLWDTLVRSLALVVFRFVEPSVMFDLPDWALLLKFLAPVEAYDRLVAALFDVGAAGSYTGADAPWFVAAWVAPVVLAAWVVVPVWLGYRRFARADL